MLLVHVILVMQSPTILAQKANTSRIVHVPFAGYVAHVGPVAAGSAARLDHGALVGRWAHGQLAGMLNVALGAVRMVAAHLPAVLSDWVP